MAVKNRLREIRHELMIDDQKEMADKLGLLPGQYNKYERQKAQPNLETLLRISRILGKPLDEIVYLDTSE